MTEPADEPAHRPVSDLPYRPCVGIALFNASGEVFLGRRRSKDKGLAEAWQMPQGGIDPGEKPSDAALRELYEETNVSPRSVMQLGETSDWLNYDLPLDLTKKAWKGRYRGQTQKWFAFGFTGEDSEIDIDRPGGGAHRPEFDAWRWAPLDGTPTLIVPFKRPVYEAVVAAFTPLTAWRTR